MQEQIDTLPGCNSGSLFCF